MSDWSSDVCSSDLVFLVEAVGAVVRFRRGQRQRLAREEREQAAAAAAHRAVAVDRVAHLALEVEGDGAAVAASVIGHGWTPDQGDCTLAPRSCSAPPQANATWRSGGFVTESATSQVHPEQPWPTTAPP